MEFERFLDLLIAKGVRVYDGPFIATGKHDVAQAELRLHLEFGAPPLPPDKPAELASLDEGMPDLGKDPDADPLVVANFPGAPKAT